MICEICKQQVNSIRALSIHLTKTHKMCHKDYYDTYMVKENENACKICNASTRFISLKFGYAKTCSNSCAQKYNIQLHPEIKLNMSIIQKKFWTDEERRKQAERIKNSDKCKAIRNDEHRRHAQSIKMIEHWSHTDNIEKLKTALKNSEAFYKAIHSKERSDKISNSMLISEKCKQSYLSKERSDKISKSQSIAIHSGKIRYLYEYNGFRFQSKDEFYYGVYLILKNVAFEYQCKCLEYVVNDKVKRYIPDFYVNGEYVEIKGKHFIKDNCLFCPFKYKVDTPDDIANRNKIYAAKYKCMIDNNVNIITDVSFYKEFVINKLGKKIADACKIQR